MYDRPLRTFRTNFSFVFYDVFYGAAFIVYRIEYNTIFAQGPLVWNSDQQGLVFSALGWGGMLSAIPSGWLADRYGPKNLLFANGVVNVIGVLLTPITALRGGFLALFVLRFIIGAGQVSASERSFKGGMW